MYVILRFDGFSINTVRESTSVRIFRVIYKKIHDQNPSQMQVQWSSAVIEAEISDGNWGRYLETRDCGYHDADDLGRYFEGGIICWRTSCGEVALIER